MSGYFDSPYEYPTSDGAQWKTVRSESCPMCGQARPPTNTSFAGFKFTFDDGIPQDEVHFVSCGKLYKFKLTPERNP